MKNLKRLFAGCMAVAMVFAFTACDDSSDDSSSKEDTVKVAEAEDISDIPDGAETELIYMGVGDLNPTGNNEKSVGLTLFEQKGGTITYSRVTSSNQYTKLGAAVTAGKDVPDLFNYTALAVPSQVIQGFYQPLDDIIDFDDAMWVGIKDTADQFTVNGEHYVVPFSYKPLSLLFYDRTVITENGLDDPQDLYYAGEWDYDAMDDLMSEYVAGASGDEIRYGINGYYAPSYVQQTGETIVTTEDGITYESNLDSAKIASAEERLSNWLKEGYVYESWIGEASEAFETNCLFYAMGEWAAIDTHTPSADDDWGVVPFPSDPSYEGDLLISSASMSDDSVLWVNGSEKAETVKVFYECYRVAQTDPDYQQNEKDKWLENNPYWGEEAYDIISDVSDPETHLMIFDPSYGVSSLMGDDNSGFMSGVSLTNWIYKSTSSADEQGETYTWTQTKEKYANTVESEVASLNEFIQAFITNGTTVAAEE
ncbi:MAG: extracellular solute-binding protein [Ruminococcus sp.]|nr:extracellular solute-binding protein [Ruminococcus sp.]